MMGLRNAVKKTAPEREPYIANTGEYRSYYLTND
jgi:hypothetical protein